jgi:hypothetical protein
MRHLQLGILCIASLSGILLAGLWPFHAPRNEVTWLKDRNGLRFGEYGTVMSTGALAGSSSDPQPCSIELWLEAATDNGGTILSFYAPDDPLQFSVNQSHNDLALQSRRASSTGRARVQGIYVNDVFQQARPAFVTITSGPHGTAVYVDGKRPLLVTVASSERRASVYVNGTVPRTDRGFQFMPCDCTGRFIVGDSPRPHGAWSGQAMGLAIYASELSAPSVRRHYDTWTKMGKPDITVQDHTAGLYLFDERIGNIVHNHGGTGIDLFIPRAYTVLDKPFLQPDWAEFSMSWGYWMNNLKNVAGFVPLGLSFCAYFALIRKSKRAGFATIILGGAVSLAIEVLQGYLPTRDSGTTDLITNTLGTWLGVLLYHTARAQWELHKGWAQEQDS